MKKAAFYLLSTPSIKTRDLYACRLAEKAYQNKRKTYIYVNSPTEAQAIDTQLWTFRDISFVPHQIYIPTSGADTATFLPSTIIGHAEPPTNYNEVLINLTASLPPFFANFSHIIEIVPNEETLRSAAREHQQNYRQSGYEIVTHELV